MDIQTSQQQTDNDVTYNSLLDRLPTEVLSQILENRIESTGLITDITQICRRLRQVALGTPTLWNRIKLLSPQVYKGEYHFEFGQIFCITKEPLQFVLDCARTSELSLWVEWPVSEGTLELIGSRKCPIRFLEIYDAVGTDMGMSRFSTLNFSSLVELHLVALGDTDVSQILDFAEESNQKALILHSDMAIEDLETHPIFDHSFMTRVVSLRLDFVDEISDSLFSDFEGIIGPFPHIKSCTIEAPPQVLSFIDLSEIEKLEFCCQGSQGEFKMDLIPDQLDELSLSRLILDPRILSLQHGRRSMANLNTLKLSYTAVDGYLRQYLNLPNLKNLYMEGIWFSHILLAEEGQPAPVDPLSDELFFQGMPRLERLSLSSLSTNNAFGASLQNCQLLRELLVHYCSIDDFVSSFADSLTNSAKFPSLTDLRIDSSWPNECTTSFLEFATTCASRRQRLAISGNERAYK